MNKRPVSQIGVGTILRDGWEVRWARVRPNGYVQLGILKDGQLDALFVPNDSELEVES